MLIRLVHPLDDQVVNYSPSTADKSYLITLSSFIHIERNKMTNQAVIDAFNSQNEFVTLLTNIGFQAAERNKLIDDGWTSMHSLVTFYAYDTASFKEYMTNLNKALSGATQQIRVNFRPINMYRLLGVYHYFAMAYYNLHIVPDIREITEPRATRYSAIYLSLIHI